MKIRLKFFYRIALACFSIVAAGEFTPAPGESLWVKPNNKERGMFADRRASRIGDILTVEIDESSTMISSLQTTTTKQASIANAVNRFLFSSDASNFGTHNGELPATNLSGDNSFSGGGQISNSSSLTARISVLVVDVLPNGNLVLEGAREISFSGEQHYFVLRGFVRPEDIGPSNTVSSENIADAQVEIITKGAITSSQKKGWLTKLNDILNPF